MRPSETDVTQMVEALFTVNAGLDRARRQSPGAGKLAMLQIVATLGEARPSEIARELQVSPSLVTRQVQDLEVAGYLAVNADPEDHRACRVSVTSAGGEEVRRLRAYGIARFASFVADWEADEVTTLAGLLWKLERSKRAVAEGELRSTGRTRWAEETSPRPALNERTRSR